MSPVYPLLKPLIFRIDPEIAHGMTLKALPLWPSAAPAPDPILETHLAGMALPNPIGLAAGFDKDAEVPDAMLRLGFGFVECGSVTPRPQAGNPKPRLFRLVEDEAVINRMGFNNQGLAAAVARLKARAGRPGVVGFNLGANKDSEDRTADYVTGIAASAAHARYITINISSPNTPGLRALQDGAALADLIGRVQAARPAGTGPLFVKLAPDQEEADYDIIARAAIDGRVDGLIVANTTIRRPPLRSAHAGEAGGLSGAPLAPLAMAALKAFRSATGGQLPLVAAGGIASAADALARIEAGATAVQLYSALVYHGPGLAAWIARDLATLLRQRGFAHVGEAIGSRA
ncbi:quinone-dependent dihydroorotate dehydrogenase [Polymorphobacter sp.]|uniref:quinone-dependent dihydroorotate dehydrogenase n=1 Tax=Polymorphobacter sp. TaxID=1909290 RepID=UPI003F6E91DB